MIKVIDCGFVYPDGTMALKNLSFSVEKGEAVALLGENGAGKSTLISALLAFAEPSSGEIFIAGLKADKKNAKAIRAKTGIVFQDPDDQLFMPTVYDDVSFGPANMGITGEDLKAVTEKSMAIAGITSLRDKEPDRLSGGQKRRAAIAGVIAMEPDILIMDEPTAGLDYKSKKSLSNLLNSINSTKLVATHDTDFAFETCRRAIILHNGELKADGAAADIFADAGLLEEYNIEPPRRF